MVWLALLLLLAEQFRGPPGRDVLDRLAPLALRVALLLALLHGVMGWVLPGTPRWERLPVVVAFHWALVLPPLWISVRWRSRWRLLAVLAWFPILLLGKSAVRLPVIVATRPAFLGTGAPFEVAAADGTTIRGLRFGHADASGVVVLVHGIGAEKCQFLPAIRPLAELGFEVWTYDQRGHGTSGGTVSTFGRLEAQDLTLVWRRMLRDTSARPGPRLIYGVSLGGAAAQLAAPDLERLDGLVLDSTFDDLRAVGARRIPWLGGLAFDLMAVLRIDVLLLGTRVLDIRPGDALAASTVPVLILHAEDDPVVPTGQSVVLETRCGQRATRSELPGRGHGTGFAHAAAAHKRALVRFASDAQHH